MSYNFQTYEKDEFRAGWVNNGTYYYCKPKGEDYVAFLEKEIAAIEKGIEDSSRENAQWGKWWGVFGLRPGLFPDHGIMSAHWILRKSELHNEDEPFVPTIRLVEHESYGSNSITMPIETFLEANRTVRADKRKTNMPKPLMGAVATFEGDSEHRGGQDSRDQRQV